MAQNAIKVFIKVRPLIQREKNEKLDSVWRISNNSIKSIDKEYDMTFDNIYDETKSTQELFDVLAKPIVTSALGGINGTIFAYGQTSSGKTHTMMGDDNNPGIIPLTVREIFQQIENIEDRVFLVRIGYIEIYNEKIFDLLDESKACAKLHETPQGDVNVNQREVVINSEEQILQHYDVGNRSRRVGETNMNERSSRSHTIFRITIESREVGKTDEESAVQVSNLNLVDLAGSESARQTKAEGDRLKEGGHINKSLLALGNVIRVLSEDNSSYINYRDSKLTRILSAALGGNAMTSIICTITPAALEETYSTLVFAQNAKQIKNKPTVNEIMTDTAIMKRMQREIVDLKNKLESEKSKNSELQSIQKIKAAILEREGQFLHSHNVTAKATDINRRRTWCPSTISSMPPPLLAIPKPRLAPVPTFFVEPSNREPTPTGELEDDEFGFKPAEEVNLDRTLSPSTGRTTEVLSRLITTPREMKFDVDQQDSPNPEKFYSVETLQQRIKYLEEELTELNDFKKVESAIDEDHKKLSLKLSHANDQIAILEVKIEELQAELKEKNADELVKKAKQEVEKALKEKEKALKEKERAESIVTSVEFEFELFREKAKKKEAELIQTLDEARREGGGGGDEAVKVKELEEKLAELNNQSNKDENLDDLKKKIENLEKKLQESNEVREKLEASLKEKREEITKISSEYEEASTQLMDQIQEGENLQKKLEEKTNENDFANLKILKLQEIILSIQTDEEISDENTFNDDESVQALLQIHKGILEMRNNMSFVGELQEELGKLQGDVGQLREENDFLRMKLPTIEESTTESESELKDKMDKLQLELDEMSMRLQSEVTRAAEAQTLAESANQELLDEISLKTSKESEYLEQINFLSSALISKESKLKEMELTLTSQETEMATEIADLKTGLKDLMTLGEENARLKNIEKDYKKILDDFNEVLDKLNQKKAEVDELKAREEENIHRVKEMEGNAVNMKINLEQLSEETKSKTDQVQRLEQELDILGEKNQDLMAELSDTKKYKDQCLDLEIKIHELQDSLAIATKPASTNTTAEFESLAQAAEAEDLQEQLEAAVEKIGVIEEQLKVAKVNELENAGKIAAFGLEIAELMQENEKIQELKEEKSENEKKIVELKGEIEGLKAEIEGLKEKLEETEDIVDTSVIGEAEKITDPLVKIEKKEIDDDSDELKIKIDELEVENQELKAAKEEIEGKLKEMEVNLQETEDKLKETAEKLQETEDKLNETKVHLQATEVHLQETEDKLKEKTVRLQETEDNLKETELNLQETEVNLQETKDKLKETQEKLNETQENSNKLQEKLTDSMEKLAESKENLADLQEKLAKSEERVSELSSKIDELTAGFSESTENVTETEKFKKLRETLEEELNEAKMSAESSAGELEVFKSKFEDLQNQLATKEQTIKILESHIEDKKNEIDEIQKAIDSNEVTEVLSQEVEQRLKEKIEEFEAETAKINEDLENSKKEVEEYKVEVERYKAESQASAGELKKLQEQLDESNKKFSESQEIFKSSEENSIELSEKLKFSEENFKSSEEKLKSSEEKLKSSEENFKSSSEKLLQASQEIENLQHKCNRLQEELENFAKPDGEIEKLQFTITSMAAEKITLAEDLQAMTDKVKELTKEKTELELTCKDLKSEFVKFEAENTNLKAKVHIIEEEASLLRQQLQDRTNEADEIKARYRRRSSDNDRKIQNLEKEKDQLVQQIGALEAMKSAAEVDLNRIKTEHLRVIEHQLPKLADEIEKLKVESSDNDIKYAVLDEKYSQLKEKYLKLELEVQEARQQPEKLEQEIASLNEKISQQISENFVHNKTIADLRDERDSLLQENAALKKKKSLSPDKRKSDLFASQNQQMLMDNFKSTSTPTRAVERNFERKNRRQSVHDERRRLSVWERFQDTECQTEAVSEICACSELTKKVKELQIEIRRKECKIATMERLKQHDPLKLDLEDARKALVKEQREHQQSKEALMRNVMKLEAKIEILNKNQNVKKESVVTSVQTSDDAVVMKDEYNQLEKKFTEMKRACRQRQERIVELESAMGKENMSGNIAKSSVETENLQLKKRLQEIEEKMQTDDQKASRNAETELKEEFERLQKKYEMTRRLCNLRNDDISKLQTEISTMKEQTTKMQSAYQSEVERLNNKYLKTREICQIRTTKLNELRERFGVTAETTE